MRNWTSWSQRDGRRGQALALVCSIAAIVGAHSAPAALATGATAVDSSGRSAVNGPAQRADQAEVLFQAARHVELSEGDLERAIELYRDIVTTHTGNRNVVARALLRMGQCYEKLGEAEAQEAYQRVLRDYPDQPEQVSAARTRLAALTQQEATSLAAGTEAAVRRVWVAPGRNYGVSYARPASVSADGQYLSFSDGSFVQRNLFVRDLVAGEDRRLTQSANGQFAGLSAMSPDGGQIVYQWDFGDDFNELRLIGVDGTGDRVLYRNEETEVIQPYAWSPNGEHVVVLTRRRDNSSQIALVSVADGSLRPLKTLNWQGGLRLRLSPDGRDIAYEIRPTPDSPKRDIFVLAADGSREMPLVEHPADDRLAAWAPNGNSVVFISDRAGSRDLWVVQLADGRPEGSPRLVRRNIGPIYPAGFTTNGDFYYSILHATPDVYVASLDAGTGEFLDSPTRVTRSIACCSDWSPDGKHLAYVSRPDYPGNDRQAIAVRSLETGEERRFVPNINPAYGRRTSLRWSPDGRSILFRSVEGGRSGYHGLDVQTGNVTRIVQFGRRVTAWRSEWSADGKAILYQINDTTTSVSRLVRRDLETGQENELYSAAPPDRIGTGSWAPSPDGQRVIFAEVSDLEGTTTLKIMPATGGEPRELFRTETASGSIRPQDWTPDGRYVLFAKQPQPTVRRRELWRISAGGGQPQMLPTTSIYQSGLRFHPDGLQVAFTGSEQETVSELWVIENFLSELQAQTSQ